MTRVQEKYKVILADPPWSFKDHLPGKSRGAAKQYKTIPTDALVNYLPIAEGRDLLLEAVERHARMSDIFSGPVPRTMLPCPLPPPIEVADNAVLFLWRVASMQADALRVMEEWGFTQKSELVWLKRTRSGKRHFGMGRSVRNEHEVLLIGHRGKPRRLSPANVRSTFEGEVRKVPWALTGHSVKPLEQYEIIERLYAGPYLELFGRESRVGWTVFGDEMGGKS